jgi:hypothetical protein
MIKMDRCYDNRYWDMIKIQNEDKEYPPNMGQKWTDQEETLLLEELDKNININIIAQNHNRTLGGIICRQKEIAYKMYFKNYSIEEIIQKTKLDNEIVKQIIERKNKKNSQIKTFSIENEIVEIKNDIKELKNVIKELVEMMKAVYEFEDA